MCKFSITVLLALVVCMANMPASGDDQPLFTIDENVWVTFYDLPSRRFRSIRDAFIRRDFESVARELEPTIGFLLVEADRATPAVHDALIEVIKKLESIQGRVDDPSVTVGYLDSAFARAHWLLSQHYLVMSIKSRDDRQHESAGRYLWATAHHLERAVLWSDARINRDVLDSLESIREMSLRLQDSSQPERVYQDKPMVLTARTLVAIGKHLDRKVWIDVPVQ
jgi:hypothetical protein